MANLQDPSLRGSTEATQPQPTQDEIDRAWRYHENIDVLFHNRVNAFVTSQSFLITGYMISFYIPKDFAIWYAFAFYRVSNWLWEGMQELKNGYLAGPSPENHHFGDPIYKKFYFHRKKHNYLIIGEEGIGKILPRYLPLVTLVFWCFLLALEIVRSLEKWRVIL